MIMTTYDINSMRIGIDKTKRELLSSLTDMNNCYAGLEYLRLKKHHLYILDKLEKQIIEFEAAVKIIEKNLEKNGI